MTRSGRRFVLFLVLTPVLIYVAICAALYILQTSLIFPTSQVAPAGELAPGATRVELRAASGERLIGLHVPPSQSGNGSPILIIGFGGNAWNADNVASYVHGILPEADVLAFHYRGYAPSEGSPSADALRADSLAVFDWAARRFPGRKIVAAGFSIGSGVAAFLASQRPLAGAILVTPFDSLAAAAVDRYPWVPVRLLFRHELAAAADLRQSRIPVAILAAQRDTLMLPARTEALRHAVPNLVYDRTIPGAGHDDIYRHDDFRRAMREALIAVLRR